MRSLLFSDFAVRSYIAGSVVGVTAPAVGTFLVQRRMYAEVQKLIPGGVG